MNLRSYYQNLSMYFSYFLPCYLPRDTQIFSHHDETDRPDGGGDIYTITQNESIKISTTVIYTLCRLLQHKTLSIYIVLS